LIYRRLLPLGLTLLISLFSGTPPLAQGAPTGDWRLKEGSVYDGDTFRVIHKTSGEEIKIRVACIDAPELKQAGGKRSRDHLRTFLALNPAQLALRIYTRDRYGRSVASVYVTNPRNGRPLLVNGEMVASGNAYFYEKYASQCRDIALTLAELEQKARTKRLGVWQDGAEKPWDFRKKASR
jgi:endonuclease YncB( thermonuclease family)